MGRPDFKSGGTREGVFGGFDSHLFRHKYLSLSERFYIQYQEERIMNYRVLLLFVAGLVLSACGDDEAAIQANVPTESEEKGSARAFFDPADVGDIVVGEDWQVVKITEEETSEWARSPTGTTDESRSIEPTVTSPQVDRRGSASTPSKPPPVLINAGLLVS